MREFDRFTDFLSDHSDLPTDAIQQTWDQYRRFKMTAPSQPQYEMSELQRGILGDALEMYVRMQEWIKKSHAATDAERELALIRGVEATTVMEGLGVAR